MVISVTLRFRFCVNKYKLPYNEILVLSCLLKQKVFSLIICLATSSADVLRIPYLFFLPKLINLFVSYRYTLDR